MAAACFSYLPQNRFFAAYCNIWDQPTTGELEILDLVVRTKVFRLRGPGFSACNQLINLVSVQKN